jgi:pSer/pThr/pTyr-binding forkhead associated (FHA) protein
MPRLTLFFPDTFPDPAWKDQHFVLDVPDGQSKDWLLGRGPDASPRFNVRTVSRRHALLRFTVWDGAWSVQDLNSTGGTFLNGAILRPGNAEPISIGDKLWVGTPVAAIHIVENEQDTLEVEQAYAAQKAEEINTRTYADSVYLAVDWVFSAKSARGKVYRLCVGILFFCLAIAFIIALG